MPPKKSFVLLSKNYIRILPRLPTDVKEIVKKMLITNLSQKYLSNSTFGVPKIEKFEIRVSKSETTAVPFFSLCSVIFTMKNMKVMKKNKKLQELHALHGKNKGREMLHKHRPGRFWWARCLTQRAIFFKIIFYQISSFWDTFNKS